MISLSDEQQRCTVCKKIFSKTELFFRLKKDGTLSKMCLRCLERGKGYHRRYYIPRRRGPFPTRLTKALSFFRTWTPDMAYVLGLLFADGCITTRKGQYAELTLELKDIDYLRFVAATIDPLLPVKMYTRADGRQTGKISIGIRSIIDDCVELGLTPRKTATLQWPATLPETLAADFVRGYFDGDGTIYCKPTRSGKYTTILRVMAFACGSPDFAVALNSVIFNHTGFQGGMDTYGQNCTSVSYRRKAAIRVIGEWLYYAENVLYLERKFLKWKEACV
jgi:hypothetical protein